MTIVQFVVISVTSRRCHTVARGEWGGGGVTQNSAISADVSKLMWRRATAVGEGGDRRPLGGGKRSIGAQFDWGGGAVTTCPENITKNFRALRARLTC